MPRNVDVLRNTKTVAELTIIATNSAHPQQGDAAVILAGIYYERIINRRFTKVKGEVKKEARTSKDTTEDSKQALYFANIAFAKDKGKYSTKDYDSLISVFRANNLSGKAALMQQRKSEAVDLDTLDGIHRSSSDESGSKEVAATVVPRTGSLRDRMKAPQAKQGPAGRRSSMSDNSDSEDSDVQVEPTPASTTSTVGTISTIVTTPAAVTPEQLHSAMDQMRAEMSSIVSQVMAAMGATGTPGLPPELQAQLFRAIELSGTAATALAERAKDAERKALEAIAQMREAQGRTETDVASLKGRMTVQEQYMFKVIKRVNELGEAYEFLKAKVAALGELDTIKEALAAQGHTAQLKFLEMFVGLFEHDVLVKEMIRSRRFEYNYGRRGLVLNAMVAIAGLVPTPGVEAGAAFVKAAVNEVEARKMLAETKKVLHVTGSIQKTHHLATNIAIAILKYNGHLMQHCSVEELEKIAMACKESAMRFIIANVHGEGSIYAEDIAMAILSGYGMEKVDLYTKSKIVAIVNGELSDSRYKEGTKIERDWLCEVLEAYGRKMAPELKFAPIEYSGPFTPPPPSLRAAATRDSFRSAGFDEFRKRDDAARAAATNATGSQIRSGAFLSSVAPT